MTAMRDGLRQPLALLTAVNTGLLRLVRDPRATGVLGAGPRVGRFLYEYARTGGVFDPEGTHLAVRATPRMAVEALIDEVLISMFHHPDLVPRDEDFEPAAADLAAAHTVFADRGWLDEPETYHRDPPPPTDVRAWHGKVLGLGYEHLTFSSGWEPIAAEPGRERWLSHEANRLAHAWVSRAPGDSGSWLIAAHGFGMGRSPFMDLRAFWTPMLHRMGIHVAVPVMPLHGARASGRVRGEDLMTIDMVDSMHGVAQGVWDTRRLIRWVRATQGATKVGVIGYSFGALVAALVASLEDDLACVIAGIPLVDLPELFRQRSGPHTARLAAEHGVLGDAADEVHRVVSPLAMTCRVPFEGRYLFAGRGDRMSTFEQARRLWLHWERPRLVAYPGSHVGFFFTRPVRDLVAEALKATLAAS